MPGPAFLHGEDVTLHVVEDADVDFLCETINDPAVRAGLAFARPKTAQAEREWVDSVAGPDADDVHLLICADGDPVGTVGLDGVDERAGIGELGYYVAADAWGNGYATDEARTLADYAFTELRLHRIQAKAFAGNAASKRVLEKVGFEREGVLRDHWYRDGTHEDVHVYGLLESEWRD